jgi:uncharacterized membrane protein
MPPADQTASGLAPRTLAALAYLAWWVTGLAVLAMEHGNSYVRFHAWQSVIGLGGIWALGVICYLAAFLMLSVSAAGFTVMLWIAVAAWAIGLVVWAVCLVKAWTGDMWKLPLAGAIAARYAGGQAPEARGQGPEARGQGPSRSGL